MSPHRRELRFPVVVSILLVAALLAFVPLALIALDPGARATVEKLVRGYAQTQGKMRSVTPSDVVQTWTRLYGKDTAQASFLTTERFRVGKSRREWTETTRRLLEVIGYAHLGGEVESEMITGEGAMVVLKARIVAVDGVSLQTEVYTLRRVRTRWLIDEVEVRDEVVPRGKLRHGI